MIKQSTSFFSSSLLFFFLLLVVIGTMIPSDGNHGILNIKSLAFLFTTFFLGCHLFAKKSFSVSLLKALIFLLFALAFFIGWGTLALYSKETAMESTFDQFKIFMLTICAVFFAHYLAEEKLLSFKTFLKTLFLANLGYSLTKVTLVLLSVAGIVDLFAFMERTGLRFMSMDTGLGLPRMQTSNDILTPYLLFFILRSEAWNICFSWSLKVFYLLISAFSIFLSFSRVMIFIGFLSLFLFWATLSASRLVKGVALFALLASLSVAAIGVENVYAAVERRLLSEDNAASDQTRTEQIEALMKEYVQRPFFGKGLGGYSEETLRDDKILHSYEVQWVAFLMQFGIVGIFLILAALGLIAKGYLSTGFSFQHSLASFLLFLSWLLASFTNPYLISLTSGLLYSLFLLAQRVATASK